MLMKLRILEMELEGWLIKLVNKYISTNIFNILVSSLFPWVQPVLFVCF